MLQEELSALERHVQDDKNKAALAAICKKSPWDDVGAREPPPPPTLKCSMILLLKKVLLVWHLWTM